MLQVATLGKKVTFTCYSVSKPRWTFYYRELPANTEEFEEEDFQHNLHIVNVTEKNRGAYICRGRDDEDFFESEGHLEVYGKIPFHTVYVR